MEYFLYKYLKPETASKIVKLYVSIRNVVRKHFYEKTTYILLLLYGFSLIKYINFFNLLLKKLIIVQDFSIIGIVGSCLLPVAAFFTSTGSRKLNDISIRHKKFLLACFLAILPLFVLLCQLIYSLFIPVLIRFMYPKIAYRYDMYGYSSISYNDILTLCKGISFYAELIIMAKIYDLFFKYFASNESLKRWVLVFVIEDFFITLNGGRKAFADLLIGIGFKDSFKLVLTEVDRFLGTLIIGSTGTGKTSSLAKPFLLSDIIKKAMYLKKINRILIQYLQANRIAIKDKIYVVCKNSKIERNQFGLRRKFPTEYMAKFYIVKEIIGNVYHISRNKQTGLFYIEIKRGFLKNIKGTEEQHEILDVASIEYSSLESVIETIYNGYKKYFTEFEILDYTNNYYIELNNIEYIGSNDDEKESIKKEIEDRLSIYTGNIGVTVIEPKGDLVVDVIRLCEFFGIRSTYVDPRDEYTENFNILQGNYLDASNVLTNTFRTLMAKEGGQDEFFALNQEYLSSSVTQMLKLLYEDDCSIKNIYHSLKKRSRIENLVTKLQIKDEDNMYVDLIESFTEEILSENSNIMNHALGLRLQLDQILKDERLNRVLVHQDGKPKTFDADEHFEYGGVLAINTAYGELNKKLSTAFGVMSINFLQSVIFRRKGTEEDRIIHHLLIDEFPQYVNEDFAAIFEMGRSYRIASTILCQSLSQLVINGDDKFKDIALTTGTHILYGRCSHKDAQHFMEAFGDSEERSEASSINRTSSLIDEPQIRESLSVTYDITTKFTQDGLVELPFQLCIVRTVRNSNVIPAKVVRVKFPESKYFKHENEENLLTLDYNFKFKNFENIPILSTLQYRFKKDTVDDVIEENNTNSIVIEDDLPDSDEMNIKNESIESKDDVVKSEHNTINQQEENTNTSQNNIEDEQSENQDAPSNNSVKSEELQNVLNTVGATLGKDSDPW